MATKTLPSTGPLEGVKVGDKLIRERAYCHSDPPRSLEVVTVSKRTPKMIEAGYAEYKLDGELVPKHGMNYSRIRLPHAGELEQFELEAKEKAAKAKAEAEAKAARESTPEWKAASEICTLGSFWDADDLLDKFDHAALIQAASILRAAERTKGEM